MAPGSTRILRQGMDVLYWASVGLAAASLVVIAVIIPWGVFTRYVLDSAASWPEPMAVLLSIVLTFFGGAACFRTAAHMRMTVLPDRLPRLGRRACELAAEALVAMLNLFMVSWGTDLVQTTWHQTIPDFPSLSVGVTYLPIPLGGLLTLLFTFERLVLGPPPMAMPEPVVFE